MGRCMTTMRRHRRQQKEYYDRRHTKSVVSFILLNCDISIAHICKEVHSPHLLSFVVLLLQMLKPGSLVLLRNSARDGRKGDKFQARYLGPYEIAKHLGKNVFRLRNPTTGLLLKKSVNACRLKLYRERQRPPLHLSNTSLFQVNTFF